MPEGVLTLSFPPLAVPSWSWPVQTPALAKKLSRPALPACPGHVFRVRAQHDNRQWRISTFGTHVSLPAAVASNQVCMSVSCKCVQQSSFPVSCMHAAKFALQPSLQSSQVCWFLNLCRAAKFAGFLILACPAPVLHLGAGRSK